jgi:hypothetical protein
MSRRRAMALIALLLPARALLPDARRAQQDIAPPQGKGGGLSGLHGATALRDWAVASLTASGDASLRDPLATWTALFEARADRPAEETRRAAAQGYLSALVRGGAFEPAGGGGGGRRRAVSRAARRRAMDGIVRALGGAASAEASPAMRLHDALLALRGRASSGAGGAGGAGAGAGSGGATAAVSRQLAEGVFLQLASSLGGGGGGAAGGASLLEVPPLGDPSAALAALLLEADARGKELLAAGVHSREIFACVVDQIMNAAPEIILQIIINVVRDPIVELLSTTLAQMLPDVLVPSSGRVAISASLEGKRSKPPPAAPPCVCAAADTSAYDPLAGIVKLVSGKPRAAAFVEAGGAPRAPCSSPACAAGERLLAEMEAMLAHAGQLQPPQPPRREGPPAPSPRAMAAGQLLEVRGALHRVVEVAPWCPCLAGHIGWAYAPAPHGLDVFAAAGGDAAPAPLAGARFAAAGAGAGAGAALAASSRAVLDAAAAADAQAAAAADAFAREAAWADAGAGAGAGAGAPKGPIAGVVMRATESLTDGLAGQAAPRLLAGVAEAVKLAAARAAPASAHAAILRRLVPALTAALTPALVSRAAAAAVPPLVLGVAARTTAALTPALSLPLALSLAHALTHNPADDYFCAYCAARGAPPAGANATQDLRGDAPPGEQRADQRVGAYCAACARAGARDRLLDARVAALVRRHAPAAVARALRALPAVVNASLDEAQREYGK